MQTAFKEISELSSSELGDGQMPHSGNSESRGPTTCVVNPEIFKESYDSPLSLAGKRGWLTEDDDARTIKDATRNPEDSVG